MMSNFLLEIVMDEKGNKLAYLSKEGAGCGYRIAGPKAWCSTRNIAKLKIRRDDLLTFIKEFSPDLIQELTVKT